MRFLIFSLFIFLPSILNAQIEKANHFNLPKDSNDRFSLHFQTTYVYQYKPQFRSPYESSNSLIGAEEHQNSLTSTLYLGARLWKGASIYINPELAGGSALSGAFGMGASSNGETFRVGNPAPTLFLGRAYLMQEFPLSSREEYNESDANQFQGMFPLDYFRIYVGKYALGDMFDNNSYSNSPRTQFLNWALMNNGAWDYAADVRGYTYAFTVELQQKSMNYKISLAAQPLEANGPKLNTNLEEANAINAEVSHSYKIGQRKGMVRLLGYRNAAYSGNYRLAMAQLPDTPNIVATRQFGVMRTKYGLGLNAEQEITNYIGAFARLGWNDGKNETWAFTEIDQTASLGISLNGEWWHRKEDGAGVAVIASGLSKDHRDYLADGGYGFVLGDSKLNYGSEFVAELYYSYKPSRLPIWFTGDYQFVQNPSFNKDRGPVNIFSLRLHVQL
ncbi:MAG: carbohydrate porin [Bacteroidetes bacterium]|nr:carbohydrate porin [Bacteroidota bacterium]